MENISDSCQVRRLSLTAIPCNPIKFNFDDTSMQLEATFEANVLFVSRINEKGDIPEIRGNVFITLYGEDAEKLQRMQRFKENDVIYVKGFEKLNKDSSPKYAQMVSGGGPDDPESIIKIDGSESEVQSSGEGTGGKNTGPIVRELD